MEFLVFIAFMIQIFLIFLWVNFSLLSEIKIAKKEKLKYIYLGYFVKKCQSLSYKADYTPNEILKGTKELFENEILWER